MNRTLNGKRILLAVLCTTFSVSISAVDGSDLWLSHLPSKPVRVVVKHPSPTAELARQELMAGWQGPESAVVRLSLVKDKRLRADGFLLDSIDIKATTDRGLLYGAFDLLRRQRTGATTRNVLSNPSYGLRLLNHWDNLDGSVERGYAGRSIFWRGLGDSLAVTSADRKLWQRYARANASIGINGTVLNNVNASPKTLDADCLARAAAVADVLRPWGIRMFLCINFSSPAELGGLQTSDPLDPTVVAWWTAKVKEIYARIPDFGGFLVKANSEGLPGPQDFGRTHADGANMLADALKPHQGIVMWRAFVYSPNDKDRAKQAYNEFMPLDGQFRDNVVIQVKNGPIDFQPREPFSPLFGALKKTAVMPEFQITQEYLGHNKQMVYLGPMWEECLQSDTWQEGEGSTVARCTDGSLFRQAVTAIAGVANIGLDTDWCGNCMAPSNWYAFGRLAWNDTLSSRVIVEEWVRQTFLSGQAIRPISPSAFGQALVRPLCDVLMKTREVTVDYSMPLGLHHIFAGDHHYGPGPWYAPRGLRKDWTPPYYHQADSSGIGFDRSLSGTQATRQYHEPYATLLDRPETCPENLLLWFHHLPWTYRMHDGKTLWENLCFRYDAGVQAVRGFQKAWDSWAPYVDAERFAEIQGLLRTHARDAQIWKDGCLSYFQSRNGLPFPLEMERPVYQLSDLLRIDPLRPFGR